MSYSEDSDGQVVLRMSREDYAFLLIELGAMLAYTYDRAELVAFLNRLNEGNPNYMPYHLGENQALS